jgi:repressor of nif and glnA expression
MDSRFGGILQIRQKRPLRFVELIEYSGSSLDPSEIFITSRMTNVAEAAKNGNGKILANFREIPAICRPLVEEVIDGLAEARLNGLIQMGNTSESICEMPVGLNKVGVVLQGGLNPVAAAVESGINGINKAMSSLIDYRQLRSISDL